MALTAPQKGALFGVTAYLIWGFAPIYWHQTYPVEPVDLLAHRALYSLPVVVVCLLLMGRLRAAAANLLNWRTVFVMACAALCSATNWGIFLWALSNGKVTEASLGYFLLPLINVVIGITIFKESVDIPQRIAIGFAVVAMLIQVVFHNGLPIVALGVAISFGLYGAIRKGVHIESVEGLFIETLMMAPLALTWLILANGGDLGVYGLKVDLFLLGAGVMTAVPLMAFVSASRLLPLTALGLVFYIGPTTQLLVAVFYFREPFDQVQLIAFSLVWVGLVIMTLDTVRRGRALRRIESASRD